MYFVNGLKHNLLSMSQMCNEGNQIEFTSGACNLTKLKSGGLILKGRHKNIYNADIMSLSGNTLTCYNALDYGSVA